MPLSLRCLLVLVSLAMLGGCTHRQFVREPYPRWGNEVRLERPDHSTPIVMRIMEPVEAPRSPGILLIVHGMNEYIGRYGDIARHFAKRFTVAGFDLYAHGLSNPILERADRALAAGMPQQEVGDAYLAQAPLRDLEPMRQDLDRVLRYLLTVGDDRPVFILSHSLGSLVAASYLLQPRHENDPGERVQGIVLLGPAFSVSELPGWRGWLANPFINVSFFAQEHFLNSGREPLPIMMLNQVVALPVALFLDGLFEILSWPGLRNVFTPVTPDWVVNYLSDWEVERTRHRADNWIIRRSLLRYVKGVEREIARFRRQMEDFPLPYFLVYSGHDPITPAWGNQDFAHATQHKHPDNQLLPLPDHSHHEHLFSAPPLRDEILARIDKWLEQRLSSRRRPQTSPP